jgi:hypothetical protein
MGRGEFRLLRRRLTRPTSCRPLGPYDDRLNSYGICKGVCKNEDQNEDKDGAREQSAAPTGEPARNH